LKILDIGGEIYHNGVMETVKRDNPLVDTLKRYFEGRREVAFCFLYGSYARGAATVLSDIDIAVYFYPRQRHPLEYEEEVYYDTEEAIWADLEDLLGKEVELLVLNRVSASVAASAIRGIPIVIGDWSLYLDFMAVVTQEAEDFHQMLKRDFMDSLDQNKFE
jgi:predicted nucleotidyltransferase